MFDFTKEECERAIKNINKEIERYRSEGDSYAANFLRNSIYKWENRLKTLRAYDDSLIR